MLRKPAIKKITKLTHCTIQITYNAANLDEHFNVNSPVALSDPIINCSDQSEMEDILHAPSETVIDTSIMLGRLRAIRPLNTPFKPAPFKNSAGEDGASDTAAFLTNTLKSIYIFLSSFSPLPANHCHFL